MDQKPAQKKPQISKPAPKPKALQALPISADDIRDPAKFSFYIYSHAQPILQQLLDTLPDVPPTQRANIYLQLFEHCLSYRPYVPVKAYSNPQDDPVAALAALLAQPMPKENP
jgi:hypothetical protein